MICYYMPNSHCNWISKCFPVAYRDFSGQASNDEMMTSSVQNSILTFDKTSNF